MRSRSVDAPVLFLFLILVLALVLVLVPLDPPKEFVEDRRLLLTSVSIAARYDRMIAMKTLPMQGSI